MPDEPKNDPPKSDPPKSDPPKSDPPKNDPPKNDPPKNDPPKNDPPKNDPPKNDPPKKVPPPPSLKPPPAAPKIDSPPPMTPPPEVPPGPPPAKSATGSGPSSDEEMVAGDLAPLNPRLLAGLIDGFVATSLWLAAQFLPGNSSFEGFLGWLLFAGYLATRDSLPFLNNQSIGKTAMKLKVERISDGAPISQDWTTALVRNALLLLGPLALVEVLVLISRDNGKDRGRRLGDEWAKTKVVVAASAEEEAEDEDEV